MGAEHRKLGIAGEDALGGSRGGVLLRRRATRRSSRRRETIIVGGGDFRDGGGDPSWRSFASKGDDRAPSRGVSAPRRSCSSGRAPSSTTSSSSRRTWSTSSWPATMGALGHAVVRNLETGRLPASCRWPARFIANRPRAASRNWSGGPGRGPTPRAMSSPRGSRTLTNRPGVFAAGRPSSTTTYRQAGHRGRDRLARAALDGRSGTYATPRRCRRPRRCPPPPRPRAQWAPGEAAGPDRGRRLGRSAGSVRDPRRAAVARARGRPPGRPV